MNNEAYRGLNYANTCCNIEIIQPGGDISNPFVYLVKGASCRLHYKKCAPEGNNQCISNMT
ncbi:hypothetical protein NQ315_007725 [Exocentrus adspersus]|uniref:Uncharacterized protein n=1 Tax=Exocentrus adspersus TaxID=1586481 RepID=A0AAV8W8P9_9CUCU|nr:hypothetical protein NQ315_007725 [Exocentrus adspersus]